MDETKRRQLIEEGRKKLQSLSRNVLKSPSVEQNTTISTEVETLFIDKPEDLSFSTNVYSNSGPNTPVGSSPYFHTTTPHTPIFTNNFQPNNNYTTPIQKDTLENHFIPSQNVHYNSPSLNQWNPSSNQWNHNDHKKHLDDEKINNLLSDINNLTIDKTNIQSALQNEKDNVTKLQGEKRLLEMKLNDLEFQLQTNMKNISSTSESDLNQFKYLLEQERQTVHSLRESLATEKQKIKEISFEYEQKLQSSNRDLKTIEVEKKDFLKMHEDFVNKYNQLEHQHAQLNQNLLIKEKELNETKLKLEKTVEEQSKSQSQTLNNLNELEHMKQLLLREKAELSRKLSLYDHDSEKRREELLHNFKLVEGKYNEQLKQIENLQRERSMLMVSLMNEIERNSVLTNHLMKMKLMNEVKDDDFEYNLNENKEDVHNAKDSEQSEMEEEENEKNDIENDDSPASNNSQSINLDDFDQSDLSNDADIKHSEGDNIKQSDGDISNKILNAFTILHNDFTKDNDSKYENHDVDEKKSIISPKSIQTHENLQENSGVVINQHEYQLRTPSKDSPVKLNSDSDESDKTWISSLPLFGKLMGRTTPQQSPSQLL